MTQKISYVFSTISPWAYIGHTKFVDIVKQFGCEVLYRPVNLLNVFESSGGLPLAKRHPLRQQYRWFELQRWREARNLQFNLQPSHWPFNFLPLDKTIIAAVSLGHDPANLIQAYFDGIWVEEKNLADRETIVEKLTACSLPAQEILNLAESDPIEETYNQYTNEALENGCFGSPTYWLNGEMYFGQDRLEHLEQALKTGRAPYKIIE